MEERDSNKREKERQEYQDSLAEMYNTMTSDMMTENLDVSKSSLGPNRQIGYLYKGMTAEERAAFKAAQLAQIEEAKVTKLFSFVFSCNNNYFLKQQRKEMEKRMEREYDDYFNGTQRTINLMDQELQQKKRLV